MFLDPGTRRRLCHARDLLCEADEQPRTIHDIARAIEVSPFHFIRQFEAVFGTTPHQFRIQARLERAKHLLAAGGHSVTDVCMTLGFSSLGSFTHMFTRRVGETPSAFRRRWRASVQVTGTVPAALIPGCFSLMGRLPAAAFRNFREARADGAKHTRPTQRGTR